MLCVVVNGPLPSLLMDRSYNHDVVADANECQNWHILCAYWNGSIVHSL